jgi:cytochrome c oxidase assembly factor CtaG
MADQAIGGAILWIPGDMMFLIAAGIMVGLWFQQEEEKGRAGSLDNRTGFVDGTHRRTTQ